MAHRFDLATYTYFDVKVQPEAVDQVLASTRAASASHNGSLVGVEYMGHVGELTNHLLFRAPKHNPAYHSSQGPALPTGSGPQPHVDEEQEDQRNKQIVDTISAIHGVVHVDVQSLRQRPKRDEL
ncbi:hypothetical protein EMPS_09195 [Entomortierella parvispora]|uniref:Uncharacterized protein n=1 Tax=Entomortierella parvispora TaxID=205924 RepID=A0A9P3HHQ7_9FUNG|nr:hypothetical protein EMPS_09195 [Entomortierella parvispora]